MTENKAIEIIEYIKTFDEMNFGATKNALDMAIKAFEEIQEYRAIGTVEGYEAAIKSSIENYNLMKEYKAKLQDYEAIGTVEELKALKEKNEPKKPIPSDYEKYMDVVENAKFLRGAYWCPNCKHTVRSGTYCEDCGQKLDWEEH